MPKRGWPIIFAAQVAGKKIKVEIIPDHVEYGRYHGS
jgi:hypothetical protein